MLKGEDYFNVGQVPEHHLQVHQPDVRWRHASWRADGELTMRGVTKPVIAVGRGLRMREHPMNKRPTCGAEATATMKRSECGMTKDQASTADDVRIAIADRGDTAVTTNIHSPGSTVTRLLAAAGAALTLAFSAGAAAQETYTIDPVHLAAEFAVSHLGLVDPARLVRRMEAEDRARSRGKSNGRASTVTIDTTTVKTIGPGCDADARRATLLQRREAIRS